MSEVGHRHRVGFMECDHLAWILPDEYGDGSAWCQQCGDFREYVDCRTVEDFKLAVPRCTCGHASASHYHDNGMISNAGRCHASIYTESQYGATVTVCKCGTFDRAPV